ncbi:uncharacterized protein LOC134239896 isoform X2 [Saccostrea cucullata]
MVMCCLIMVGLTFIIWLVAMATPGWIVAYVRNDLYPTGVSLKMSLFYYVTCESTRTCDLLAISWDMADPSSYPPNKPSIPEIQIVSTFAIILCGAVFVLELVNLRIFILNPSKTVTSAILMLIAIVSETVLIGRTGRLVTRVTDEFKRIHRSELADLERKLRGADITNIEDIISFFVYRIDFPYSIFIASLGVLTGVLAFTFIIIVFYRNRKSQRSDTVCDGDNPCRSKSTS